MKFYIKVLIILLCFSILIILPSCKGKSSYYDDEKVKYKSSIKDMGGSMSLSLKEENNQITIENELVRIVLYDNGSIKEYANKEVNLYLTKDQENVDPIVVEFLDGTTSSEYKSVSHYIESNSSDLKKVSFTYLFEKTFITTFVSLKKGSNEVEFNIEINGNSSINPILDIEYPIIEGIDKLENKEREYFLTPYATGYLFENPLDNFNDMYFGIGKSLGLYPSGWYYPMQFSAYYSEGIGGFYWQTKDEKDGIKSFTFTGKDDHLRLSVWHYVDDYGITNYTFGYPFVIKNLVNGSYYESADIYKEWALKQSWVSKGKTSERTDISKDLYENTTLTIFGYRSTTSSWRDCLSIYEMYANVIEGKFYNISIYHSKSYMDLVKEYDHLYSCFEFNSLASKGGAYESSAMLKQDKEQAIFMVGSTPNNYICASDKLWRIARLKQDKNYLDTFGADALYFDVDVSTMHPIQCYDETHEHGTRINVLQEFYLQYQEAKDMMNEEGLYSVGGEMITEQLLPYFDYYQARANGGLASWMENDLIRPYLEMGVAHIVPLFTYIYHEYGGLRLDGYLVPDESLSNTFYHTAAYTALTGGIVEFNYEYYYPLTTLPSASSISIDMLEYVNKLGFARMTYGKDYLVYGDMVRSPEIGTGKSTYEFNNPNYTPRSCNNLLTLSGEETLNDCVVSAFKNNGKVAIFISNITDNNLKASFVLHAGRDYNINSGDVYLVSSLNGERIHLGKIKNGNINLKLDLTSKEVYMLEIVGK